MHISINMSDPWHICYTLILSKINQRLSYIFIYRLNIEIYLYLFLIIEMFSNYRNIKDPQRYLTQTSYIFLTPMNLRLISSASLCDLLQWEATKNQVREFGPHKWWSPQFLWKEEKIKELVSYWHYAALSFSSGLLCFWDVWPIKWHRGWYMRTLGVANAG